MNEVEIYCSKKQSGPAKKKLVVQFVNSYIDKNEEIRDVIIDLLFQDLKQVHFLESSRF